MSLLADVDLKTGIYPTDSAEQDGEGKYYHKVQNKTTLFGSCVLRSENSFHLNNGGRKCQGCPLRRDTLFSNPLEDKMERAPISRSMGACWQAVRSLLLFRAGPKATERRSTVIPV